MGKTDPDAPAAPAAVDDRRAEGRARRLASAARRTCSATTTPAATPRSIYENVRVPADNLLGEEGGGFAISQARLGPGRIHHCMRSIGVAERALELHDRPRPRAHARSARSSPQKGLIQDWIAESRIEIDMAREYVLHTAHLMDTVGNKAAATEISGHQGRRAEHGAARSSTGRSRCTAPPASRSSRRSPTMYAQHAHAAHRRRPRRGAQDDDRPPRDPPTGPGDPAVAVTAISPPVTIDRMRIGLVCPTA